MHKKTLKIIHVGILSTILLLSGVTVVLAQNTPPDYTLLAPLPGVTGTSGTCVPDATTGTGCTSNLNKYLPAIFNLSIGVGAVAAFVVITIGGLEYMLTDSLNVKLGGKQMIEDALWGLGLLIFAYAILYTVNPALLQGSLNITTPTIPTANVSGGAVVANAGGNVAGVAMTPDQVSADAEARAALTANPDIKIQSGACTAGQTTGCVDLNGITSSVETGLNSLASKCGSNCVVTVSGGTEAGHSTGSDHNAGNAVDILGSSAPNDPLTNIITGNATSCTTASGQPCSTSAPSQCNTYSSGGGTYLWEPKGASCGGNVPSSGDHWHVSY